MVIKQYNVMFIAIFYAFSSSFLENVIKVPFAGLITLPITALLLVFAVALNPKRAFSSTESLIIFLLLFIAFFQASLSSTSFISILGSAKDFIPFLMILLVMLSIKLTASQVNQLIRYIYIFCYSQIPVTLAQVATGTSIGDDVGGLFGHGQNQFILLSMAVFNIISSSYYLSKKISLIRYIGDLMLSLIPATLASTVYSYPLFFVHLVLVLFTVRKNKVQFVNLLSLAVGSVFFLATVAVIHDSVRERGKVATYFESDGVDAAMSYGSGLTKEGTYGRMASNQIAFAEVCENNYCFGYGLGASNVGKDYHANGVIEQQHGLRKIGRTQVSFLLIEFGLLGVVMFIFLFVLIYKKAGKLAHLTSNPSFFISRLTILTLPLLFVYQKPLNYCFSSFILALLMTLPYSLTLNGQNQPHEN